MAVDITKFESHVQHLIAANPLLITMFVQMVENSITSDCVGEVESQSGVTLSENLQDTSCQTIVLKQLGYTKYKMYDFMYLVFISCAWSTALYILSCLLLHKKIYTATVEPPTTSMTTAKLSYIKKDGRLKSLRFISAEDV